MKNRNQYIYFITINNTSKTKKFISTDIKLNNREYKALEKVTTNIKYIKKEHHFETEPHINGNPQILILKLPDKKHKGIYTGKCTNCKTYIKNARKTQINPDIYKCPLCKKNYPQLLREQHGTN